ncbi:catalase [Dichomitus squalens]|uniref:Catalase n=1 Tax=Dichomitus squalens TaxID=114155 RepID=A0A4Q9PGT3_9APHY|nr:catalase [Dichomitus squalens]
MASFIQDTLAQIPGIDPRVNQRMQFFSGMNDGPAKTAARITGVTQEPHAKDDSPIYTGNFGQPIPDPCHSLNIGGIPYQGDALLLEKQQAFDRMKITERIVHPCGSSAFGYFQVNQDVSHLTKAAFLQPGKRTPVYSRFSTVTYGREFPDSARNPRGFATKFYTEEGNYDLVGLNFPVFFVRDPFMGPDNIRSQQRHPKSFLLDYNAWFDYLANVPESQHAGLMLLSDHATPVGWRFMSGYGVHTFRWVNKEGSYVFVKYHWISKQGVKQWSHDEATRVCGEDPDYSKRDLFEHIEKGGDARWTMMVQVMQPEQIASINFDPFEPTKIWPRSQFPMQEVGELVLNRNPEDYFRDVEQAAFSPGSLVPGIEASPDPLLQWRMFFYRDAQYHRLGSANIHQIPVNCPFMAKFHSPDNYNGTMRIDGNTGGKPYYFPNSYHNQKPTTGGTPGFLPSAAETPMQVANHVVSRIGHYLHEGKPSEYDQVRELYNRVLSVEERENLHRNTARLLKHAEPIVQKNYLIQQCAIMREYAEAIYDLLPEHEGYSFKDIEAGAPMAHMVHKNPQFVSDQGKTFMGMPVRAMTIA